MGRKTPSRRIGLALGSGGARGWCHVGVLRALNDIGVKPDVISGASMGALIGAFYAGGALDALEDWAGSLTARGFFGMLDIRPFSGGLVEGIEITRVIEKLISHARIEDLPMPFVAVSTDMATGREVWLTQGGLADAVRASVALPGVISPHRIDGKWFLDGGLTNPVPVTACRMLGADIIIAVNPNGRFDGTFWAEREQEVPSLLSTWSERLASLPGPVGEFLSGDRDKDPVPQYFDVLSASIDIMTEVIRRSKLAGDPPHLLLDAHLSKMSVLEFHRASEAIEEGRRLVEENAEEITRLARA